MEDAALMPEDGPENEEKAISTNENFDTTQEVTSQEDTTQEVTTNSEQSCPSFCQTIELVLIIYAPIMMMCQTLIHFYTNSRIGEEYLRSANRGFPSLFRNIANKLARQQEVQRLTNSWMTKALAGEFCISSFSIFLIHFLGETYGRKFGMLVSLSGTIIKLILITLTIALKLPLKLLIVASVISGATGGSASFITCVVSHISDMNKPKKFCFHRFSKAQGFAIGISGFFIIVFSAIIEKNGYLTVILCLLGLAILSVILIIFCLEKPHQKTIDWNYSVFMSSFRDLWKVVLIRKLLLLFCFVSIAAFSYLPVGGQSYFATQFFINRSLKSTNNMEVGLYLGIFALSFYFTTFFASMSTLGRDCINVIIIGCLILGFISSIILFMTMKMYYYQTVLVNNVAVFTIMYFIGKELFLLVDVRLHGILYAVLFSINLLTTTLMLPLLNLLHKKTSASFPGSLYIAYSGIFLIAASLQIGMWFYEKYKKD